jgi:hypothetical protein
MEADIDEGIIPLSSIFVACAIVDEEKVALGCLVAPAVDYLSYLAAFNVDDLYKIVGMHGKTRKVGRKDMYRRFFINKSARMIL